MTSRDLKDNLACAGPLLRGRARFLARGATCTVFTDGVQVVRISEIDPDRAARFHVDAQIRGRLLEASVPTPRTFSQGTLPDGRAYSIENLIRGDDSTPRREGWTELGRTLRALHTLPHQGYGLLQDRSDVLLGQCSSPAVGLLSRLHHLWPFNDQPLPAPLMWAAPDLIAPLTELRGDLLNLASRPTAVCHTDLHRDQLLWWNGRLAALLDFGDATIGPPAWDWASLAFFHGWEIAAQVAQEELRDDAALFGLLLSLHRANRALHNNQPARVDAAKSFALSCLARLQMS